MRTNEYLKEKFKKETEIYKRNYEKYKTLDREKAVFWGVRRFNRFNYHECSYADLKIAINEFEFIKNIIRTFTYRQMMMLFPIEKDYSGRKYECKDYYSTMEYLEQFDLDDVIGDNVDEFFFNYYNCKIINFSVFELCTFDRIARLESKPGLLERFLEEIGK